MQTVQGCGGKNLLSHFKQLTFLELHMCLQQGGEFLQSFLAAPATPMDQTAQMGMVRQGALGQRAPVGTSASGQKHFFLKRKVWREVFAELPVRSLPELIHTAPLSRGRSFKRIACQHQGTVMISGKRCDTRVAFHGVD